MVRTARSGGDPSEHAQAVIGRTTRVRGRVSGDGSILIEGNVRARGLVRIEAGARVRGDITAESVALEEGAEFVGRLDAAFELPAELGGTTGGRRR